MVVTEHVYPHPVPYLAKKKKKNYFNKMCASKEIFLCHQFYHQFYHKDTPETDYHNRNGSHRLKKKKKESRVCPMCVCVSLYVCLRVKVRKRERERKRGSNKGKGIMLI